MFTGELKVGDKLIWRHTSPPAFAEVSVERVTRLGIEDDPLVRITNELGWHCEMPQSEFQRHCMRDQKRAFWFFVPAVSNWQNEWDAQAKAADQPQ